MPSWVNTAFRVYLRQRYRQIAYFMAHPEEAQQRVWQQLIQTARVTVWGKEFGYQHIRNREDYARRVPVQDYEQIRPYITRMMHGERDVLWPGQTRYFAKSSGTTGDRSKYIPVTGINLRECHIMGGRDAMALFYARRPDASIFAHRAMIMGGSLSAFESYPGTVVGDVSAIMIDHIPFFARPQLFPDVRTALLADWEEKLARLAEAGLRHSDVVMTGGVPTWTVVLFRRMLEMSGRANLEEIWPAFQLYVHGGVSFSPYRRQFAEFFPSGNVEYQEVYNATEGYFAAQDRADEDSGMLLLLSNGIYYEFLPVEEWASAQPRAIPLREVELGRHYAIVISTSAGLWRYMPGDTVQFTSLRPYRMVVSGRTKAFVNAFGEEVMVDNTDRALAAVCREMGVVVSDYTVAPVFLEGKERGGHEWLVEFERLPADMEQFSEQLDKQLQRLNSDYEAKRHKDLALQRLRVRVLPPGTFHRWLRVKGKLGGQHKVPRLANHRKHVEEILELLR
jgi:hypothetical protein